MKIVIFTPHADDELIAAGGSILKWKEEGHNIYIVYMTDGKTAYTMERRRGRLIESTKTQIIEIELAIIRSNEADKVTNFLGIPQENVYKFDIPSHQMKSFLNEAIEKTKFIIKDADIILLPSNNNWHEDHQDTYDIVVRTAQKLDLTDVNFYGYTVYGENKAPKEKVLEIPVEQYVLKIYEAFKLYKSQLCITHVLDYLNQVKSRRYERFGVYKLSDLGKYYNF